MLILNLKSNHLYVGEVGGTISNKEVLYLRGYIKPILKMQMPHIHKGISVYNKRAENV